MQVIQIKVGETKDLRFPGLGTAGYMWKCTLDDSSKLKVEKKMAIKNPADNAGVGASNEEIFAFTGLQKGTVNASFMQHRHWEPDSAAIKKEAYSFEVI